MLGAIAVATLGTVVLHHKSPTVLAGRSDQAQIKLPPKYREWRLISVAHEAGNLNDIRAVLGNDLAFKAYSTGQQTLPDGAMIARLAWAYTPSTQNNKVFGTEQSFVAGAPTNIQIMLKDSKRFASTGSWGYAQFADPNADNSIDQAAANTCFACHTAVKEHDFIFTRYAP